MEHEVVLITRKGISLRFHEGQLRDQGRNTVGVWGIPPEKTDHVVAIAIVDPETMLLVAAKRNWQTHVDRRIPASVTRRQRHFTMKAGEKTGEVVGALSVRETDEIMLITIKGRWSARE